jgi:transcriptional regulator
MYVPGFTAVDDEEQIRAFVSAARTGWIVTSDSAGVPAASLLPIIWHGSTVIAHMAKANPQWRDIGSGCPGLVIVAGPEAYVTPTWYPSKAEHGRAVPTWNYVAVHLTGSVQVRRDPSWLRAAVAELTELHETGRAERWAITDASNDFVDAQLKAIVGIELTVERVDAKAKLSQNRPEPDRLGVLAGLADEAHPEAAAVLTAMRSDAPLAASGVRHRPA